VRTDAISYRRALAVLFHMYHANNQCREQMEALFSSIFRLLDTAKPPVKETLLIIMGSLGKYVPRHNHLALFTIFCP
jgi:serine/threonine-protein kinase ATR